MSAIASSCNIPPMTFHVARKGTAFDTGQNASHMRIEGEDSSFIMIRKGSHDIDVTGGIWSHVWVGQGAYNIRISLRANSRVDCSSNCRDIFIIVLFPQNEDFKRLMQDHPVTLIGKGCKNITFNGQKIA